MKQRSRILFFTLIFILSAISAYTQGFPEIPKLSSFNPVFSQYQDDVKAANMAVRSGKTPQPVFYVYRAREEDKEKDTVISVAARCCIPQETLATLNSISEAGEDITGKKLILPNAAGLFIPENPQNALEILLAKENSELILNGSYPEYTISGRKFYFLQGKYLSMSTRAFFLESGMHLPLQKSVLTSSFGMRKSPISGRWKMHNGIDMAAPLGSEVYACKSGKVLRAVKNDSVYGNYIVLEHANKMTSLYAHLSDVYVKKDDVVSGGSHIANVGLTGLTTGPHLHFEIQTNGRFTDPTQLLPAEN